MDAEAIRDQLGVRTEWQQRGDGHWIEAPDLDVRAMARLLRSLEARWVTLTVTPAPGGGFRLIYHWDLDGQLLSFVTGIGDPRADSIADILPAADWVEREMRDYYALEFTGREDSPALMLRPGDEPGLFSRTQEMGRERDPVDDVMAQAKTAAEPASGAAPGTAAQPTGDGGAT